MGFCIHERQPESNSNGERGSVPRRKTNLNPAPCEPPDAFQLAGGWKNPVRSFGQAKFIPLAERRGRAFAPATWGRIIMNANTPEIEAKIAARRAGRLATAPSSWQGVLKRSWTGNSRKQAIKAFCGECQGFDRAGIADCKAYACPLWKFRPFQKP